MSKIINAKVESSQITELDYNGETEELVATFKGGTSYLYNGIPVDVYMKVVIAESVGKEFNATIKAGGYEFTKLEKVKGHDSFIEEIDGYLNKDINEIIEAGYKSSDGTKVIEKLYSHTSFSTGNDGVSKDEYNDVYVSWRFVDELLGTNNVDLCSLDDFIRDFVYISVPKSPLDRAKIELSELQARYNGLSNYIGTEAFLAMGKDTQDLLVEQRTLMNRYIEVLQKRIDTWK